MNTASRLQHEAPVGGVVVGERTYQSTQRSFEYEALPPVSVRRRPPRSIWRVVGPRLEPERAPLAPLIGRGRELELLGTVWDKVRADQRTHLVTVFGAPGIGKSRLVRELEPRISREGLFLKGRCRPYGETTGYGAFGQQVFQLAEIFETDPTDVAARSSTSASLPAAGDRGRRGGGAPRTDPARALARRHARQAAPVLLRAAVHGGGGRRAADGLRLRGHPLGGAGRCSDLLGSLASRLTDVPAYLITLARPTCSTRIRPGAGASLATPRCTSSRWTMTTRASSPPRSSPAPRQHPGTPTASCDGGGQPAVPRGAGGLSRRTPTAGASRSSRPASRPSSAPGSTRCRGAEPEVLQDAAVVGQVFWRNPLRRDPGRRRTVRRPRRPRAGRLHPSRIGLADPGEQQFTFKHILIREVASDALPRSARRDRHRTVAAFIEQIADGRCSASAWIRSHIYREAGNEREDRDVPDDGRGRRVACVGQAAGR